MKRDVWTFDGLARFVGLLIPFRLEPEMTRLTDLVSRRGQSLLLFFFDPLFRAKITGILQMTPELGQNDHDYILV